MFKQNHQDNAVIKDKRVFIDLLRSRIPRSLLRRFNALRWLTFLDLRNAPTACSGDSKSKATGLLLMEVDL